MGKPTDHVKIKVISPFFEEIHFEVLRVTQLWQVIELYCQEVGTQKNLLSFFFEGRKVKPSQTPIDLDMEDGDQFELTTKLSNQTKEIKKQPQRNEVIHQTLQKPKKENQINQRTQETKKDNQVNRTKKNMKNEKKNIKETTVDARDNFFVKRIMYRVFTSLAHRIRSDMSSKSDILGYIYNGE